MKTSPTCIIIAGPNGAGKTTFALKYLPMVAGTHKFINADLIASGLAPLDPASAELDAARLFLAEIEDAINEGEDFAFETTLSGRAHLRRIRSMREAGWGVRLIYLYLPNLEMSIARVAARVLEGGHDIPLEALLRRYSKSLHNLLYFYEQECDEVVCMDNRTGSMKLIFERNSLGRTIYEYDIFRRIQHDANS